jgi:tyrosine decarboxylase
MGLVCFRLCGDDKMTQELLAKINISGKLHMIPACVKGKYIIRFCVTAEHASPNDIGTYSTRPFKTKSF